MTSRQHSDWIPYRYAGAGPHLLFNSGVRPTTLPRVVYVHRWRGAGSKASDPGQAGDTGRGRGAPILSPSSPTPGPWGWRHWSFLPQLWGPLWAEPACPAPLHTRQGCWKGPVPWACLGLFGSGSFVCPPGEGVHTTVSPLLGPAHRVTCHYSSAHTRNLQACTHRTSVH